MYRRLVSAWPGRNWPSAFIAQKMSRSSLGRQETKTRRRKRLIRARKREGRDPRVENFRLAEEDVRVVGHLQVCDQRQANVGEDENIKMKNRQRASTEEEACRVQRSEREGSAQANLQAGRGRHSLVPAWRRECGTFCHNTLETRPKIPGLDGGSKLALRFQTWHVFGMNVYVCSCNVGDRQASSVLLHLSKPQDPGPGFRLCLFVLVVPCSFRCP